MDVPLPDCLISGVTLFDAELHGKGSTGCENFDSTPKEHYLLLSTAKFCETNYILRKLCHQKQGGSLILEHHVEQQMFCM